MQRIQFQPNSSPTLGVEIELGLVDAETMALSNSVGRLLPLIPAEFSESCKPELMQSCIEINSKVCATIDDARQDLSTKLLAVQAAADSLGLRLWWGGTHPFSSWRDQLVTPDERYENLVFQLQEMARRLITFGLHVHVGVDSGDKAVMICDRIMQHLPTLLALSASSPFWDNRDTGLHSLRSKIMEGLPTAGLPTLMRNWSEYLWIIHHLIDTDFIKTIREIWWDVRPHHGFGTVEVRVCDMPGNLEDVLSLAAMIQCVVKTLSDQIDHGAYQHDCHPMMVRQNKWRACRYGNQARLVNSYTLVVQPVREITQWLIEKLRSTARQLQCEAELERAQELADEPNWSDRQRAILASTGDPSEICRQLIELSRIPSPVVV
jgi:carboxylate-amine ligase